MEESKNVKSAPKILDRAIKYIQKVPYVGEFEYNMRLDLIEELQALKACLAFINKCEFNENMQDNCEKCDK